MMIVHCQKNLKLQKMYLLLYTLFLLLLIKFFFFLSTDVKISPLDQFFNFGVAGTWLHGADPHFGTSSGTRKADLSELFLLTDEKGLTKYGCERCGKLYKWKQGLRNHVRLECGKPPQFHCSICTYKTHRKENLNRHCVLLHKMSPYMK